MAGRQGFEPRFYGPEPHVLPLDDLPVLKIVIGRDHKNLANRNLRKPNIIIPPLLSRVDFDRPPRLNRMKNNGFSLNPNLGHRLDDPVSQPFGLTSTNNQPMGRVLHT